MRTYKLAVDNACDQTQAGMLAMHQLEEKTNELLEKLKAMDQLEAEVFVTLFFIPIIITFTFSCLFFRFQSHRKDLKAAVALLEAQVGKILHP